MVGRVVRGCLALCLAAALCGVPRPLLAQADSENVDETLVDVEPDPETQVKALFEAGQEHYKRGEYAAAADAFREANRLSSRPALLYNLAQAERLNGDCSAALQHYREFESSATEYPPDLEVKIAEMVSCEQDARKGAAEDKDVEASKPAGPSVPKKDRADESGGPRQAPELRVLGWAAVGGAALSTVLGTILMLRVDEARRELDDVNRRGGQWSARHQAYEDSMNRDQAIALGLFIGAGVLAGSGTVMLILPSVNARAERISARVSWRF